MPDAQKTNRLRGKERIAFACPGMETTRKNFPFSAEKGECVPLCGEGRERRQPL